MGYMELYTELERHSDRISKGDKDLKQDLLCLTYTNYRSKLSRGTELTIGELVNFMQLRAGELRQGKLLYFGNRGHKGSKDVYSKVRYFNGDVKLSHLDGTAGTDDLMMEKEFKKLLSSG